MSMLRPLTVFALLAVAFSLPAHSESAPSLEVKHNANVYRQADSHSDVIYQLRPDASGKFPVLELVSTEKQNGYFHVRLPGQFDSGWVYKSFVRPLPAAEAGPSPEHPVGSLAFVPGCSTLPFATELHAEPQDIDRQCGIEGAQGGSAATKAQNRMKDNLCAATGSVVDLTLPDFKALQVAADDLKSQGKLRYGAPNAVPLPEQRPSLAKLATVASGSITRLISISRRIKWQQPPMKQRRDAGAGELARAGPEAPRTDAHVSWRRQPEQPLRPQRRVSSRSISCCR